MILLSLLAASFFINLDSGVIPAALLVIEQDLSLSDKEIAILNGVTFLVCGALTIFTAPIMLKFEARSVLIFCALCNSFGSFMFLLTSNYWLLVLGRSLNGMAQALICTYSPVWINEFAPKDRPTTWMAYI